MAAKRLQPEQLPWYGCSVIASNAVGNVLAYRGRSGKVRYAATRKARKQYLQDNPTPGLDLPDYS